jgi:hypothetical protein
MSSVAALIQRAEDGADGFGVLLTRNDWEEIKTLLNRAYPNLVTIKLRQKYVMDTKKGRAVVQVTKENRKTWVMYEVEGSARPGTRWMVGKTWCTPDKIQPVHTDSRIPSWVEVK